MISDRHRSLPQETLYLARAVATHLQNQATPCPPDRMDHNVLLQQLRYHKLELSIGESIPVPEPVGREISRMRKAAAFRALQAATDLAEISKRFSEAGIDMLTVKGPALSIQLYGDPLRRVCGDIDILVRPQARADAMALLRDLGWGTSPDHIRLDDTATFLASRQGRTPIEVHTQLAFPDELYPLAAADPFGNSVVLSIAGRSVPTLISEAAISYVAHHGSRHHWSRLGWLVDIAAASLLRDLDWDRVGVLARAAGAERQLAYGVCLSNKIFGIGTTRVAQARSNARWLRRALKVSAEAQVSMRTDPASLRKIRFFIRAAVANLGLQTRLSGKFSILQHRLLVLLRPSPKDTAAVALPRALSGLYVLIRPFRILADMARRAPRKGG